MWILLHDVDEEGRMERYVAHSSTNGRLGCPNVITLPSSSSDDSSDDVCIGCHTRVVENGGRLRSIQSTQHHRPAADTHCARSVCCSTSSSQESLASTP